MSRHDDEAEPLTGFQGFLVAVVICEIMAIAALGIPRLAELQQMPSVTAVATESVALGD